jgi:hypothetical protein
LSALKIYRVLANAIQMPPPIRNMPLIFEMSRTRERDSICPARPTRIA